MTTTKTLLAAAVAALVTTGAAQAATLTGEFSVTAVNVTNLTSAQSRATRANFDAALDKALGGTSTFGGSDSDARTDTFTYTGALDFFTNNQSNTTIGDWLATGGGTLVDLDGFGASNGFADLQQSKGSIGSGTATTTFYLFDANFSVPASDFTVIHDDGIAVFENAALLGDSVGPTARKVTEIPGFGGGEFEILYVATNSDPSILNVDVAPVPLPAAAWLLMGGLAGLGVLGRKRRAA
jgi:hypothetical protein